MRQRLDSVPAALTPSSGHKSITTTVDLYGHLVPEASGRARDALDKAFRSALPVTGSGLTSHDHYCTAGQRHRRRTSRPVGRVLCTRESGPAAIHLGLPLPAASCGPPASIGRATLERSRSRRSRNHGSLLTLLRVGFTEPPGSLRALVVSYTTVSPLPRGRCDRARGGLFSVALSRGSPRVGVTDHPALRSPDLPRRAPQAAPRPPGRLVRHLASIFGPNGCRGAIRSP